MKEQNEMKTTDPTKLDEPRKPLARLGVKTDIIELSFSSENKASEKKTLVRKPIHS